MLNAALIRELEREMALISDSTGYGEITLVVECGAPRRIRSMQSRELPRDARSGVPPPSRTRLNK